MGSLDNEFHRFARPQPRGIHPGRVRFSRELDLEVKSFGDGLEAERSRRQHRWLFTLEEQSRSVEAGGHAPRESNACRKKPSGTELYRLQVEAPAVGTKGFQLKLTSWEGAA